MKNWMRISLISVALLGATGASVWAHPADASGPMGSMSDRKHERMAARQTQRLGELKGKLHLDASQEAAWKTYTEAMQPPADHAAWPDRTAMAKMTTPERIDQMQAMHQRMEEQMKKRGEATKTFYAVLNNDQKKVFDVEALRMMPGGDGQRRPHHPH